MKNMAAPAADYGVVFTSIPELQFIVPFRFWWMVMFSSAIAVRLDEVAAIGELLLGSGITTIEVPLNSPNPFASIETLASVYGALARIGAGTVVSSADVRRVADAGGTIMVPPDTSPDVIRETKPLVWHHIRGS